MAKAPTTKQAQPTAPQPRDARGRVIDQWGLPVSGPARAAELEALGRKDPAIDPSGWPKSPIAPSGQPAAPSSQAAAPATDTKDSTNG